MKVTVTVTKDEEAGIWIATSEDVPGLVTGSPSLDELAAKLEHLVPECLRQAGQPEQQCEIELRIASGLIRHRSSPMLAIR